MSSPRFTDAQIQLATDWLIENKTSIDFPEDRDPNSFLGRKYDDLEERLAKLTDEQKAARAEKGKNYLTDFKSQILELFKQRTNVKDDSCRLLSCQLYSLNDKEVRAIVKTTHVDITSGSWDLQLTSDGKVQYSHGRAINFTDITPKEEKVAEETIKPRI
jgi:hypothetical protein